MNGVTRGAERQEKNELRETKEVIDAAGYSVRYSNFFHYIQSIALLRSCRAALIPIHSLRALAALNEWMESERIECCGWNSSSHSFFNHFLPSPFRFTSFPKVMEGMDEINKTNDERNELRHNDSYNPLRYII